MESFIVIQLSSFLEISIEELIDIRSIKTKPEGGALEFRQITFLHHFQL